MPEKHYLLESLLKGDSEGIEDIYRLIYPKVEKFICNNNGDTDHAKDIFQKVLMQLITRIKVKDYQLIDSFEAYVFTASKNLWRRELNKKKRVTNQTVDEQYNKSEQSDMALAILEQDRWELYRNCFYKLSDNCREILGMYFNQISYSKMMEHFSYASETVVRQRVFKCKAKLTEFIRGDRSYKSLKGL